MNKMLVAAFAAMLLVGCAKRETRELTNSYTLPPELQDCSVFKLTSDEVTASTMYALRCPNSTTTTTRTVRHGKTTHRERVVVIDGVTYKEAVPDEVNQQSNIN